MAKGRHYGAAADYARKKFGGDLVEDERDVTINTTAGVAIARDPERVFLFMLNVGANTVFLKSRTNPTTSLGIRLDANGGFVSFDAENDATMPAKEWNGIAAVAASTLYVLSLRRESLMEEK